MIRNQARNTGGWNMDEGFPVGKRSEVNGGNLRSRSGFTTFFCCSEDLS